MALGTGDTIFWTTFGGDDHAARLAGSESRSGLDDVRQVQERQRLDRLRRFLAARRAADPHLSGSLPYKPKANYQNVFYMVNNLSPGFLPNGNVDTASITAGTKVPPWT